jgi:hypothetical protein
MAMPVLAVECDSLKINNFPHGTYFVEGCAVVTKLPVLVIWLPFVA